MKVYVESSGCSRRKLELSKIYRYFEQNGYSVVKNPRKADYIVLSTCAFRKEEEEYSLGRIKALRDHRAKLVVFGCLPEIAPTRFEAYNGIEYISPKNIEKIDSLFESIEIPYSEIGEMNTIPEAIKFRSLENAVKSFVNSFSLSTQIFERSFKYAGNRMRSALNPRKEYYLFVCKGCMGNCSYCAIKHAVGRLRSKDVEEIVGEYVEGVKAGFGDFIILGDDVGAYGLDVQSSFPALIRKLAEANNGSEKRVNGPNGNGKGVVFHIDEIHPRWLVEYDAEITDFAGTGTVGDILCPVQSGSRRILKLMNRYDDKDRMLETFRRLRSVSPDTSLSTHMIAGFPSETEADFEETLDFIPRGGFKDVTIFPYDEKERSLSREIEPKVSPAVINNRVKRAVKYFKRHHIGCYLSCPAQ